MQICWLFFLYENFKIVFQKHPETSEAVANPPLETAKTVETARALKLLGLWVGRIW